MAEPTVATLSDPLEGCSLATAGISIVPLPLARKISLRVPPASVGAASAAFGVVLPTEPGRSARSGTRSALWLGPDEWLIIDENAEAAMPAGGLAGSIVDISHRNRTIEISGRLATATLAAGCPLDLSLQAFPVGKCTRTLFGKVDIILWRTGEETFRIDYWPSFSAYLFAYLSKAAQAAAW